MGIPVEPVSIAFDLLAPATPTISRNNHCPGSPRDNRGAHNANSDMGRNTDNLDTCSFLLCSPRPMTCGQYTTSTILFVHFLFRDYEQSNTPIFALHFHFLFSPLSSKKPMKSRILTNLTRTVIIGESPPPGGEDDRQ